MEKRVQQRKWGVYFLISIYPSLWISERVFLCFIYGPGKVISDNLHFNKLKPAPTVSNGDSLNVTQSFLFILVTAVFLTCIAWIVSKVFQKVSRWKQNAERKRKENGTGNT